MTVSDRERALIETFRDATSLCPYNLKGLGIPLEGSYGPNTCDRGCYDEPVCHTEGPWPIDEHPDLLLALAMTYAEDQVNNRNLPDDHPLYVWWEEHCDDSD